MGAGGSLLGRQAGFSLVEVLMATCILLVVTTGVFSLLDPTRGTFRAQTEASELQQRLRVIVDAIGRDLSMAGAGPSGGAAAGSLLHLLAPVLPRATAVQASPDDPDLSAVTIVFVPATAAETTIREALTGEPAAVSVHVQPGCPLLDALCGFNVGMRVLIAEPAGPFGIFTVTGIDGDVLHLHAREGAVGAGFAAGSTIVEVVSRSYYLNRPERRLYVHDGYRTNLPLVEDVIDLRFDYFGVATPPALLSTSTEVVAPWTTYGPRPPHAGVDHPGDDWGPGENCTFAIAGEDHVPRLADWLEGDASGTLVPIDYGQLADGPWCPGRTTAGGIELSNRYDADMLRVRRVRVTLRVQVGSASLRGTGPSFFLNPGSARRAEAMVPDREIRFDVAPRNMNLRR